MSEVTQLLSAIQTGQPQAAEALLPIVYDELRRLARQKLAQERAGQTLEATALVHEAYLRLVGGVGRSVCSEENSPKNETTSDCAAAPPGSFDSRGHFFVAAAEAMRRILVDAARRKSRLKHGGGMERQPLEEPAITVTGLDEDLVELDAALAGLEESHPRKAQLVKLRYFAGLTIDEAATALDISTATAERDWSFARAWLFRKISQTH